MIWREERHCDVERRKREGGRGGGGGFWNTSAGLARDVRVAQPSTVRRHTLRYTFHTDDAEEEPTDERRCCGAKIPPRAMSHHLACVYACRRIYTRVRPLSVSSVVAMRLLSFFSFAAPFLVFPSTLGRRWRTRLYEALFKFRMIFPSSVSLVFTFVSILPHCQYTLPFPS